jgi:hypothetical protein
LTPCILTKACAYCWCATLSYVQDHAVLAVNHDGKWLILDNRWDRLYEDKHLKQFKPLMAVDADGVHYLNKMFRIADSYDP